MQIEGYHRSLSIIHLALLAGQFMFLVITLYLIRSFTFESSSNNSALLFAVPIGALLLYFLANKIYNQRKERISAEDALETRLMDARSATIIRLAFIELGTIMAIFSYYISANFFFILVAIVLLIYFYLINPSKNNISEVAKLSPAEAELL